MSNVILGDYEIISFIGKGTFSKLVLGIDRQSGKHYAIKMLSQNKHSRNKHLKEIEILKKMTTFQHPFILRYHSGFQTPNHVCIVGEYLNGNDLREHMNNHLTFSIRKVTFYAACILLALEHLHITLQIAHCDVKPENVVLDLNGYAKLVDLGSAEIGPSNVLKMADRFVCFWTNFVKLQCRDIWKFTQVVQEMIEKKVPKLEYEEEEVTDLIKYGHSMDSSDELNKTHYSWIKSHNFFKNINWDDIILQTVNAPSFKFEKIGNEQLHLCPKIFEEITKGSYDKFIPLPGLEVIYWDNSERC